MEGRKGRLLARFAKIYVLGIFRMNAPGVRNSSYTLERVTTMLKTLFRVAPRRLVSSLRFSEFSPFPPLPSPVFPVRDNGLTKQTRFLLFSNSLFSPFSFFSKRISLYLVSRAKYKAGRGRDQGRRL